MKRKPPQRTVVALRGEYRREVIAQQQLRDLEGAQRAEWMASKRAALLSERIKAAIERGAEIEPGELYYDRELEMVRTKKTSNG